jgi:hypothetical protein
MNNAVRAGFLLATGAALRDCALLAAGVLLLCANHRDRLDDIPDRAHAWLRCLIGGALLVTAGSLLAAHTGSVFFGWWPLGQWRLPMWAWVLPPIVALGGLAWREITLPHAVAALGQPQCWQLCTGRRGRPAPLQRWPRSTPSPMARATSALSRAAWRRRISSNEPRIRPRCFLRAAPLARDRHLAGARRPALCADRVGLLPLPAVDEQRGGGGEDAVRRHGPSLAGAVQGFRTRRWAGTGWQTSGDRLHHRCAAVERAPAVDRPADTARSCGGAQGAAANAAATVVDHFRPLPGLKRS